VPLRVAGPRARRQRGNRRRLQRMHRVTARPRTAKNAPIGPLVRARSTPTRQAQPLGAGAVTSGLASRSNEFASEIAGPSVPPSFGLSIWAHGTLHASPVAPVIQPTPLGGSLQDFRHVVAKALSSGHCSGQVA